MEKRPIVHTMPWKLLPAIIFVMFMVGGILPTALMTGNFNPTGTVPEPRAAVYAPKFLCNFTNYEFNTMNGIAINPSTGNVYITNINGTSSHKVLIFDSTGTRLGQIGGASSSASDILFNTPIGIAVNSSGYIFVADSANHYVKVYDSSGTFQFKMGTGTAGSGNGQFRTPTSVAVNSSGYIYVSDSGGGPINARLQIFTPAGIWQSTFIFESSKSPGSLAINSTGHLYIARSGTGDVAVYHSSGSGGTPLYTITGFSAPRGIAINSTGRVHVADAGTNNRVAVYDNAGKNLYYLGGTGSQSGQMNTPSAVAINPLTEHLYELDDGNNRVQLFGSAAPSGVSITINGGATITATQAVTLTLTAQYATQMCFSNNGTTYTDWETFATTKAWSITAGDGLKTVYFKVRGDSESGPASDSITLQVGAQSPSGVSITINGGAVNTSTQSVTLTLAAQDATEMCLSNDGITYTDWEPFATTRVWALTAGDGLKTVYFKVRGTSESAPVNDTITLDTTGGGQPITDPLAGFLIAEYIVFGVLFGAFAVFEIILPRMKKGRDEPTRLKAVKNVPDKR